MMGVESGPEKVGVNIYKSWRGNERDEGQKTGEACMAMVGKGP